MLREEVGMRIGALVSAGDGVVRLLGYGTYDGDEIPPADIGGFNIGWPNPKLTLDSGEVVWGCECWWGSEEEMQAQVIKYLGRGWVLEQVDIKTFRNGGE